METTGAPLSASARPQSFPVAPSFGESGPWDHTSCRYLESGLSFYSDKITACGVVHHGTGTPELAAFDGGAVPLGEIERRRTELIRQNQIGGTSACSGCPNLVRQVWPRRRGMVDWIGITHFNACNNACDYCWLQWAENGRGRPGHPSRTYQVVPAIDQLAALGLFADDLVVDYGGGGEPTLMPEFDELLARFCYRGAEQWLHTNGVRLPGPVAAGELDLSTVRVVCSVDAGTAGTYFAVKQRNHFHHVWAHLTVYRDRGAVVLAKYIMQENNCAEEDVAGFVARAQECGVAGLQWDIDLRFPEPSPAVLHGLARLADLAAAASLPLTPANIGLKSAHRAGIFAAIESARRAGRGRTAGGAALAFTLASA